MLRSIPKTDSFDLKHGTNTAGTAPLWMLTIHSPNALFGVKYQATSEQELVNAIEFLQEDLQRFTFIDLGCGKGRTLLVASAMGFKAIIGLEFASELVDIARNNIAMMGITNASVIHSDAAEFSLPNCDLVLYLYNPFSREVMKKVVANLQRVETRRLYVIYKNPLYADAFESSGFLVGRGSPPARPTIQVWAKS